MKLKLDAIAPSGEAIGRTDGLVVFTPFGLPGEEVEVEITERKRNFARATLQRVVQPAVARVEPPCPYFGVCGGCTWQQIAYSQQLTFKTQIVHEQLTRIGKITDPAVRPCLPSPRPFAYRNHARFARSAQGRPGYRAAKSHEVVEIAACPILEPELEGQLQQLAAAPIAAVGPAEWDLRLAEIIHVGDFAYHVSPQSFFQVNTQVAVLLVQEVLSALALQGSERLLDLYCGVGLFTLPLARRAIQVIGVEANKSAMADAQRNLAALGEQIGKVTLLTQPVEKALDLPAIAEQTWDAIVVDPPRAGVDQTALLQIIDLAAPTLVYISCDPATLARDARLLSQNGYALVYAQPLDMFPQTHHVETVAKFVRADYVQQK